MQSAWMFACTALAWLAGCEGNHSALAKDPDGTGGAGGSAVGGEGGGGGEGLGGVGGSGGAVVRPEGPTKLTIVGGIVDYDAVALCFVPYPDGDPVMPWPSGGLEFAGTRVVDPIDTVIPADADVNLWVIGGDLTGVFGQSCQATIEDPTSAPGAIVAQLGLLPASVFAEPRSLLLVPHGCLGGATHEHDIQAQVCGPDYAPDTPAPGLLAAGMSRLTSPGRVGFQVAHAVVAMDAVEVDLTRGIQGAFPSVLSSDVSLGAVVPFPPFDSYGLSDLGVVADVKLSTVPIGLSEPTSMVSLGQAMSSGPLEPSDIASSQNYVAVAVGAAPGIPAGPWWHTFTYAIVASDP